MDITGWVLASLQGGVAPLDRETRKALMGREGESVKEDIIADILEGLDLVISTELEPLQKALTPEEYREIVSQIKEGVVHILDNI